MNDVETPLSIVVLAYDEEENIGPVLAELLEWLRAHQPGTEVIVVDDGSRDETAAAATAALADWPNSKVLRHATNGGMGAGLKTGVRAAKGRWVTFLPADGQIHPDAIGVLMGASENRDVVFSVYDQRDDGPVRTLLSLGVRTLITAFHGVRIRSDGPYLFRRDLFDERQLVPDTFFLNFEFPIRVAAAGLQTATVTIECRPRLAGQSKTARLGRIVGVGRELVDLRRRRLSAAWRRF